MSHWTKAETPFKDLLLVEKACQAFGILLETGKLTARGYQGNRQRVDAMIKGTVYDIGFKWNQKSGTFDIVADEWGLRQDSTMKRLIKGKGFNGLMNSIKKQYAVIGIKKLALRKGHSVKVTQQIDGTIKGKVRILA